jgi:hypothetical protein
MRPDPLALETSLRALLLWQEMAAAYDEVDRCLESGEWNDSGSLASRLSGLEERLRPLTSEVTALRGGKLSDPALDQVWRDIDRVVEKLAERQPVLAAAARSARDATAALLVKNQGGRSKAARYRRSAPQSPRFASRRV